MVNLVISRRALMVERAETHQRPDRQPPLAKYTIRRH